MLPQIGPTELLIILTIILLFFGAKRIPELARSLGRGTREFREGISEAGQKDEARESGENSNREEALANGTTREAAEATSRPEAYSRLRND